MKRLIDEGYVEAENYLSELGCTLDDQEKTDLLCEACEEGKLVLLKKLIQTHKCDPQGMKLQKNVCKLREVLFTCSGKAYSLENTGPTGYLALRTRIGRLKNSFFPGELSHAVCMCYNYTA